MNDKDIAWNQIEETRSQLQKKIGATINPTKKNYEDLLIEVNSALTQISSLSENYQFSPDEKKKIGELEENYRETINHFQKIISDLDRSAPNVPVQTTAGKNLSVLERMEGFLKRAQENQNDPLIVKECNSGVLGLMMDIRFDSLEMKRLKEISKEFDILMNPPGLNATTTVASSTLTTPIAPSLSSQTQTTPDSKTTQPQTGKVPSPSVKEVAPISQEQKSKGKDVPNVIKQGAVAPPPPPPPPPLVTNKDRAKTTQDSPPVVVEAVEGSDLAAEMKSSSELIEALREAASQIEGFTVSPAGQPLVITAGSEKLTVSSDKGGIKFQGSAELGAKTLEQACANKNWNKLDFKVTMPTVKDDIRPDSPEGKSAIKAFEEYTNKGFHVQNFPLEKFRPAQDALPADKEKFAQLERNYNQIKLRAEERVAEKPAPQAPRAG